MDFVYICFDDCTKVESRKVFVKDIATVFCSNTALQNKIRMLKIYSFPDNNHSQNTPQITMTALYVVGMILQHFPNIQIIPTGSTDFIIERNIHHPSPFLTLIKAVCICLITFFGSAFTIMTFNNDAQVHDVFQQTYTFFSGAESDGFTSLELGYSIGVGAGILIFYNHFGKKKNNADPTPLQMEMRLYENDIHTTILDDAKRQHTNIDA